MVRLLDACVQALQYQGMNRMYIDAVKGGEAGFQSIGMLFLFYIIQFPTHQRHMLTVYQASKNGRHTERSGRVSDGRSPGLSLEHSRLEEETTETTVYDTPR